MDITILSLDTLIKCRSGTFKCIEYYCEAWDYNQNAYIIDFVYFCPGIGCIVEKMFHKPVGSGNLIPVFSTELESYKIADIY